ncbi:hypothetical protein D3C81_1119930 [compost metagenome]
MTDQRLFQIGITDGVNEVPVIVKKISSEVVLFSSQSRSSNATTSSTPGSSSLSQDVSKSRNMVFSSGLSSPLRNFLYKAAILEFIIYAHL